ncbi:hypothetical protein [Brevundimonas bullata]|uniref:hypothetical protein n=1 Tax=Brevundimonas bullata TaxID=13160 RepID=UPI003D9A133C
MREIAAAASLTDSPMTDQEALHTLSAIAAWVEAEAPRDGAACRAVIHLVIELTGAVDIEALDDGEAETFFTRLKKSSEPPAEPDAGRVRFAASCHGVQESLFRRAGALRETRRRRG